jgi:chromosome partitioning protein
MGIAVSLVNQKGGVGKTSTCHHLAGTLAKAGRRILLVDNDPQASLTQGFWGPEAMRAIAPGESVAALYDPDSLPIPEAIIRPTGIQGVSIVPGSGHLTRYNQLPPELWAESERGIREFLAEAGDAFDVALIDNPPNLHLCGWAGLAASDGVVVPLQAEDYGAQGLGPVQAAIAAVRERVNPGLALLGFLLTMFDKRLAIHLAYETHLRALYGETVFRNCVPLAKDFKEAVAARLPISHYKPKTAAARTTRDVADELLARIAAAAAAAATASVRAERSVA